MTRRALAPLLLLLLTVPGCASLGSRFEAPEVFLIGLAPLPGGALEQRFLVQLRVLNPNDTALEIDGVDFTLDVNGARLTRGVSSERLTIPRLGEGVVQVTATTTLFDIFRQLLIVSDRTDLDYELRGRILRPGVRGSLRFERSGTLQPPTPPGAVPPIP
ncbi:MAG: LEA type 2 family protein [Myxococcota bacterium]|nr:LEA type 2 family protein [Myxococcota bacterium]